jgi:hypothetical protein
MAKLNLKDKNGACTDFQKALSLGNTKAAETIKQFCQ